MSILATALVAIAGFVLGVRVGIFLGYRGERKRRERELAAKGRAELPR